MDFSATILFYLLFGLGIAAAVALRRKSQSAGERCLQILTSLFFWPLYVPLLLQKNSEGENATGHVAVEFSEESDQYSSLVSRVEVELDAVLQSLDGWAENVLAREESRIAELRAAWRIQLTRIREIDRLLALEARTASLEQAGQTNPLDLQSRVNRSEQARRDNFARLQTLRNRLSDDLMGTLAWVRELISMIHLAKFTGAPVSRTEELVGHVATAVEGLSEVTRWHDDEQRFTRAGEQSIS